MFFASSGVRPYALPLHHTSLCTPSLVSSSQALLTRKRRPAVCVLASIIPRRIRQNQRRGRLTPVAASPQRMPSSCDLLVRTPPQSTEVAHARRDVHPHEASRTQSPTCSPPSLSLQPAAPSPRKSLPSFPATHPALASARCPERLPGQLPRRCPRVRALQRGDRERGFRPGLGRVVNRLRSAAAGEGGARCAPAPSPPQAARDVHASLLLGSASSRGNAWRLGWWSE